jgi:competence protein CoiA
MKYAIINDEKLEATPKSKARCHCCSEQLIAKCGSINVWHWSHFPKRHCDNWWENETIWHRHWKSHFSKEEQEVVLFDKLSGEKHIADIKTSKGLILELQNSPISEDELLSREIFYDDMFWIINGRPFINQFIITPFKLPPPDSELANDIHVVLPPYLAKNSSYDVIDEQGRSFGRATLVRKSKTTKIVRNGIAVTASEIAAVYNGGKRESFDSTRELENEIDKVYKGHHFYFWKRPREVWFKANKPVLIDFGADILYKLCRFNEDIDCVQILDKKNFILECGGKLE